MHQNLHSCAFNIKTKTAKNTIVVVKIKWMKKVENL